MGRMHMAAPAEVSADPRTNARRDNPRSGLPSRSGFGIANFPISDIRPQQRIIGNRDGKTLCPRQRDSLILIKQISAHIKTAVHFTLMMLTLDGNSEGDFGLNMVTFCADQRFASAARAVRATSDRRGLHARAGSIRSGIRQTICASRGGR